MREYTNKYTGYNEDHTQYYDINAGNPIKIWITFIA